MWYQWLALGGLILVILYFSMWIAKIYGLEGKEDNDDE